MWIFTAQQAQFVLPKIIWMLTGSVDPSGGFQFCSGPSWVVQGRSRVCATTSMPGVKVHEQVIKIHFPGFYILFCFLEMDSSPIQAAVQTACPVLAGTDWPSCDKSSPSEPQSIPVTSPRFPLPSLFSSLSISILVHTLCFLGIKISLIYSGIWHPRKWKGR